MGLISRVSSRTYRKSYTTPPKWVLDVIHGTSDERPVAESHRCTRSESLRWDDLPPTPRSWPSEFIPCDAWEETSSTVRFVSTTATLDGLGRRLTNHSNRRCRLQ